MTPAELAAQARDSLVLVLPTVHRSPTETNNFEGTPFTWVNLSTWFWTEPGDFQPVTQTVTAGAVSATVTARPMSLFFDPGTGGAVTRCVGPGTAWTPAAGNTAPPGGCGYTYEHVTEGSVTTALGITWEVTWTGTGGAGGTLPVMETRTEAPLRVMQVQVVNQ